MRPNMRPMEKTDLKGALRSLTVYLQKSLGVILLALVLAALFGMTGVWLAFCAAEAITAGVMAVAMKKTAIV